MQKIQLPNELAAQFEGVQQAAEVCDESGMVKAITVPVDRYLDMFDAWAGAKFDPVALERARQEPGGYTTKEVLAFIDRLVAEHGRK